MFTIYCSHPISGLPYREVFRYYDHLVPVLSTMRYRVLSPMTGKDFLRLTPYSVADPMGPEDTPWTAQAIIRRSRWMIDQADVVYADFTGAAKPSIGSCFELAWAHDRNVHTVVVMEANNPHRHCFVLATVDVFFTETPEAMDYLATLAGTAPIPGRIDTFCRIIP